MFVRIIKDMMFVRPDDTQQSIHKELFSKSVHNNSLMYPDVPVTFANASIIFYVFLSYCTLSITCYLGKAFYPSA